MTCEFGISKNYKYLLAIIIPESILRSSQISLIVQSHNSTYTESLVQTYTEIKLF